MKKLIPVLAILAVNVFAQEKQESSAVWDMEIKYNVRAGINFSSVRAQHEKTLSRFSVGSSLGFHVGGMVDIPIMELEIPGGPYLLGVHPGVQFINKSSKEDKRYTGGGCSSWLWCKAEYSVSANYIEVPVPLSFSYQIAKNFDIRADAGPYFAIGLFGKQKFLDEFDTFYSDGLSRFDFGFIYGATFDLMRKFSFGFHLSSGMTDDGTSSLYMTLGYRI